jgi:hypothetical protein
MKPLIWALFTACLAMTACARPSAARPDDFGLTLEWDTGALPPPYHYSYTITINPDLSGQFSFQPGYAPENLNEFWETEFDLQNIDLDALYQTLIEKDALRSKWSTGQPLLGGQGTSLTIIASGKEYKVPSVSILTRSEREKVEALIEIIRGYVPQTIWDEMASRQAKFEAGFEY